MHIRGVTTLLVMSSWEYPVRPEDSTSFLPPPAPAGPLGEVITIAHTKGGAGKTSLTFNLAFALSTCGAQVLVIDLDQQTGQSVFLGEAGAERSSGAREILVGQQTLFAAGH